MTQDLPGAPPRLTARLRAAAATPLQRDDGLDLHAELDAILAPLGLSANATGGRVMFSGRDPIVPSVLHLASAASLAMVAKSVAIAALWRMRSGEAQDIAMDLRVAPHRLCPFYDRRWERLNGFVPGTPNDPHSPFLPRFYRTADARWVMPLNPYPGLKHRVQALLNVPDQAGAVANAIQQWRGADLEVAGAAARVVMPLVRSLDELMMEPQYADVLSGMDLIEIEKLDETPPMPLPADARSPLDGVRCLGMGHVIAGGGIGRALALHGADVLNLWRPNEFEMDFLYHSAQVGTRSATVDPRSPQGSATIRELLRSADVFYANRQPGLLESLALSPRDAAALRPGIVHVTITLNGNTGPWANRLGFDQTAGCLSGLTVLEGSMDNPRLPPIGIVNDYIVAWLCTAGAVAALRRRAREGGSYRVHVSLTRVALWLISLGVFDKGYSRAVAGSGGAHDYLDPEVFSAETPLGFYEGVTDQVRMSATPGSYRTVMVPRGSCRAEWL